MELPIIIFQSKSNQTTGKRGIQYTPGGQVMVLINKISFLID